MNPVLSVTCDLVLCLLCCAVTCVLARVLTCVLRAVFAQALEDLVRGKIAEVDRLDAAMGEEHAAEWAGKPEAAAAVWEQQQRDLEQAIAAVEQSIDSVQQPLAKLDKGNRTLFQSLMCAHPCRCLLLFCRHGHPHHQSL